jgi:hypothetical protein
MYLRKNRVKCGETRRTYLSIAHNVWWSGEHGKKAQSRPVVLASFGVQDKVDLDLAREIVDAVEQVAPRFPSRRGEGKAATMKVAAEIRKIEPFLKVLVSKELGLSQHLPPFGSSERARTLQVLIRRELDAPVQVARPHEILAKVRSDFGVTA